MQLKDLRRPSLRTLASGGALGALCGLLMSQLGFSDIVGYHDPVDTLTAGLLVGMVVGAIRWDVVILVIDFAMIILILFLVNTPVMGVSASRWVRDDGPITQPLDAVAVLSSDVNSDSSLDVEAAQRLLTALALMKAGDAPRLVTSRVEADYRGQKLASDVGARRLVGLAGEEAAWSIVDSVHSTRDEATQMARLLFPAGSRSIALVTSPLHTRRACETFEAVGFQVHCVASHEGQANTRHPIDTQDRLAAFRSYLYERLGMVKYRWKGWLPKGD